MIEEKTGYKVLKTKFSTEQDLNKKAISYDGISLTFKQLFNLIDIKIKEIQPLHKKGDEVEVLDTESIESVILIYAANELGLHVKVRPPKDIIIK